MKESVKDGYPREMLLLYGNRNGKQYKGRIMQRTDLTPSMNEMRKNAVCLVFCPLYYRNTSLGYIAMDPGNGIGSVLYPMLMLLNGALMSLYLQTNLKRSAATIERMATEDIMTGLLNRRGYMERAPVLLEQAKREERVFTLLIADMDDMKDINDKYGHMAGDEAICRMGMAIRCLEKQGITPVHISGDEFLAYGIMNTPKEAQLLPKKVKDTLSRMNREDSWICSISASIGAYYAAPGQEDDIDMFITMADRAMYAEKKKKKEGGKS